MDIVEPSFQDIVIENTQETIIYAFCYNMDDTEENTHFFFFETEEMRDKEYNILLNTINIEGERDFIETIIKPFEFNIKSSYKDFMDKLNLKLNL
jgi:hypothetical protein